MRRSGSAAPPPRVQFPIQPRIQENEKGRLLRLEIRVIVAQLRVDLLLDFLHQ